jgi:Domain of unknown function (DUF927)
VAERYNDNLLPLDEIGQCSPEAIGSVIYFLMNKGGKQRANQKGDALRRCGFHDRFHCVPHFVQRLPMQRSESFER